MFTLGIIPARYASSRFPGKVLVDIKGKPMLQRVYENALQCKALDALLIATDDARIEKAAKDFGAPVVLTRPDHESGTDRCAEALQHYGEAVDLVVNIQGDEPFVQAEQLQQLVHLLVEQPQAIATLAKQIKTPDALHNPNVVKLIRSQRGEALYFSRQAIPYQRDTPAEQWLEKQPYYKHLGLYAYRAPVLQQLAQLAPSPLEQSERLEQLRWLDNGYRIAVGVTALESQGIDTPEDLERLLANWPLED